MIWVLTGDAFFIILLEFLFPLSTSAVPHCSIFALYPPHVNTSTLSLDCNNTAVPIGGNCTFLCDNGYHNPGPPSVCMLTNNGTSAAWDGVQQCLSLCANKVQDQGESDQDCGGDWCTGCNTGMSCIVNSDCMSFNCVKQKCSDASPARLLDNKTASILAAVIVLEIVLCVVGILIWRRCPRKTAPLLPPEEEIVGRTGPSSSRVSNISHHDIELARNDKKTLPSQEPDFLRTSTGSPVAATVVSSSNEEEEAKKRLLLSEAIEQKQLGSTNGTPVTNNTPRSATAEGEVYVV